MLGLTTEGAVSSGSGSFVGRSHELRLLDLALADAAIGCPRLVWIEGPAGMGKTALVRHFSYRAGGDAVVWAAASRDELGWPWETLAQLLAGVPQTMRDVVIPVRAAMLAGADPACVVRSLLASLAASPGAHGVIVVVLDDIQWADDASAQALRSVFRRLEAARLLIIATARPDERPGTQQDWQRLVAGDCRAQRVDLGGLGAKDVCELAASRGKPIGLAAARRLSAHTGGNPAHAGELIDECDHAVLGRGWGPLPAPRQFSRLVGSILAACSPPTQALVQAVAVLSGPVSLEVAAGVAGVAEPLAALEEAMSAGLLAELVGDPGFEVAFSSRMAQVAVYHALGPDTRRRLHSRAMELSDGEVRLRHREGMLGCNRAEREALAAEIEAMAHAELARGEIEEASGHFDQAAALAQDRAGRQRRLRAAAEAYIGLGDAVGAMARLDAAETPSGTECGAGLMGAELRNAELSNAELIGAELSLLAGEADRARSSLEATWEQAEGGGDVPTASSAASHLAMLALHRAQPDEVMRWASLCWRQPARDSGRASFAVALGRAIAGETASALAELDSRILQAPCTQELYLARGALRMFADDLAGATADLGAVLSGTRGHARHLQLRTHALALASKAEFRMGRWDQAIAHAEASAALAGEAGRPWHAALAHSIAALALLGRGEWSRAAGHVRMGEELAGPAPGELVGACVARARGAVAAGMGDHHTALAAYAHAETLCNPAEPAFYCDPDAKVVTLLALGRLDEAKESLDALGTRAAATGRRSTLAQVSRCRAVLESGAGNLDAGLAQLRMALAHLDGLDAPYEEARVRLALGQACSDHKEALAQLGVARSLLAEMGARPLLASCDRALESIVRKAAPDLMSRLTRRERQVAGLAAAGLRNKEIADRLYVNIKTVEANLTLIYAKLGITTRWQLREQLEQVPAQAQTSGNRAVLRSQGLGSIR
jgi:DNA-binding CsgD family transcriptional regulator